MHDKELNVISSVTLGRKIRLEQIYDHREAIIPGQLCPGIQQGHIGSAEFVQQ